MFDIGWGELLVIGIVALIAIGPKELPGVLRALGQWMAKIRSMAAEFQGQFQEAMREAEMADLKKTADDFTAAAGDLTNFNPMAEAQKELDRALDVTAETPKSDSAAPAAAPAEAPKPEPALAAPEISVPLPEMPAPISDSDFAPADARPKSPAGGGA
jgi:sec-independent protein translocase protein TatB